MVKRFKYLRTILMNQNSIQQENISRWKSGNACYHLVQNLLSSSSLSKIIKIKTYRNGLEVLAAPYMTFSHIQCNPPTKLLRFQWVYKTRLHEKYF